MEKALIYTARPGSLALSIAAFSGLTLLAAALWEAASGYVILLFIPALLLCFYQMVLTPTYGLSVAEGRWKVMTHDGDRIIPAQDIAHLRIEHIDRVARATLVLIDGNRVEIPFDLPAQPLELIQVATESGVPVRTA